MPKIKLIVITAAFVLFFAYNKICAEQVVQETVFYNIMPAGRSEYRDLGIVDLRGKKLKLVTFQTQVLGFSDLEKIYLDPETLLPVLVERDITLWPKKEYIIEDYDQKNFGLAISKFNGDRKIKQYVYKESGPIHNAVYLPFYLRTVKDFKPGWIFSARFPEHFRIKLEGVEQVSVPAGKFLAYHFTSDPEKFEVWLSKDNPRLPVKIKGMGGFGYTLEMTYRIPKDKNEK